MGRGFQHVNVKVIREEHRLVRLTSILSLRVRFFFFAIALSCVLSSTQRTGLLYALRERSKVESLVRKEEGCRLAESGERYHWPKGMRSQRFSGPITPQDFFRGEFPTRRGL